MLRLSIFIFALTVNVALCRVMVDKDKSDTLGGPNIPEKPVFDLNAYKQNLVEQDLYKSKLLGPFPQTCAEALAHEQHAQGETYLLYTGESQIEEAGFRLKQKEVRCLKTEDGLIEEPASDTYVISAAHPRDCASILANNRFATSSSYEVFHPDWFQTTPHGPMLIPIFVFCDMDTAGGGWTIFQRRQDGSENFNRNWVHYENGFGATSGEFWLGLRFIHLITSHEEQVFFVRMQHQQQRDWSYAMYHDFTVSGAADNYRLGVGCFIGNDSHTTRPDAFLRHSGHQFSTYDNDNDACSYNCALDRRAGYWFADCCADNQLNGPYHSTSWTNGAMVWGWNAVTNIKGFTTMGFKPLHWWSAP